MLGANSQNEESSATTCTTNTYKTANGQAASTTGNITGIYDMSGGAWEYVMGVFQKNPGSSGFISLPDEKYYDNYTKIDKTTACNSGICYGHALSETINWYNAAAIFVNADKPWLSRGGRSANTTGAGIFTYTNGDLGIASTIESFRIVLSKN